MSRRVQWLIAALITVNVLVLIGGGLLGDKRSCERQINPREVQRDFLSSDALFQQALADLDGPAELTSDQRADARQIASVNLSLRRLEVSDRVGPGVTIDDAAAVLRHAVADRWRRDAERIQIPDCGIPADG